MIVIEARNDRSACGRKRVSKDISQAMKMRNGQYGVYVARSQAGLAREIGDCAEGHCEQGPFVACIADHLLVALRFAIVDTRLRRKVASRPEADISSVREQLNRIRTVLRRVGTIKNKVGALHKNADALSREAEHLQREVRDITESCG